MPNRQLIPFLLILLVITTSLACGQTVMPTIDVAEIPHDFIGTGTIFIWAIGNHDEQLARSLLTERAQDAVDKYCENGNVTACLTKVGLENWGVTKDITFASDFSDKSTAVYSVTWSASDQHTWIVLEIVIVNGEWQVDSWRGFISSKASEGEFPYDLFKGTDSINLFPPDE